MSPHAILFVDDEANIRNTLVRLLRHEPWTIRCASCAAEALDIIQCEPCQILVSDQRMPGMNGVDFLSEVRQLRPDIIRLMLTGYTDISVAVDAINRGEIYRMITKPWNNEELKATLRQAIDHFELKQEVKRLNELNRQQNAELQTLNHNLERTVQERTAQLAEKHLELRTAYIQTIRALAEAVDAKDAYTRGHSERVGVYASKLARELHLDKKSIETVYIAGLLHDVGKIGIPDHIITKRDRLTVEEYQIIKQHPGIGAKILEPVAFLANVVPCVRHHHEWFDGSERGYPDHIAREQIPFASRIILIADTVEAMTSDRPYRKAVSLDRVIEELWAFSGSQLDPRLVTRMVRLLEREGSDFIRKDQRFDIYELIEAETVDNPPYLS